MDSSYLKKAAEKCGFNRDVYKDRNVPTSGSNVVFVPFLGNLRSTFFLSSNILKKYKEKRSSKYLILGSWPGHECLFPYVDEYWSVKKDSNLFKLALGAENFYNTSSSYPLYLRNLNEFFDVAKLVDDDLSIKTNDDKVNVFLPSLLSSSIVDDNFRENIKKNKNKIVVYPVKNIKSWQKGKIQKIGVSPEFWVSLINRLIKENITPVVYMDEFTFNLSSEFGDKCMYIVLDNMAHVLTKINQVGCLLNIFSDLDKLAIMARCPYISVNERRCYIESKDYQLEDMYKNTFRNIFSFSTHVLSGINWETNLFDIIIKKIKELHFLEEKELESTLEINKIISYSDLKVKSSKKMGVKFIKKRSDERIL